MRNDCRFSLPDQAGIHTCLLKALRDWGDNLFSCWEKQSFLSSAQASWTFTAAQTTAEETILCYEALDQQFQGSKRRWPLIAVSSSPFTSLPEFVTSLLWNPSYQVCLVKLRHTLRIYKKNKCPMWLFHLQFRNKTELLIISSSLHYHYIFLQYFITGFQAWFWTGYSCTLPSHIRCYP